MPHTSFLNPMAALLNDCRVSREPFSAFDWRGLYCCGPAGAQTSYEQALYSLHQEWFERNPHFLKWLYSPRALVAPSEYFLPEIREALLVSPKRLALHLLPFHRPDIFGRFKKRPNSKRNNENLDFKRVRYRFRVRGAWFLVATCHGVSIHELCEWTGHRKSTILKDIREFVSDLANTIPYWIWVYNIDMNCIPAFSRHKGSYRRRIQTLHALQERPQFVTPTRARNALPKHLHSREALSLLPRKPFLVSEVDYFLLTSAEIRKGGISYLRARNRKEKELREASSLVSAKKNKGRNTQKLSPGREMPPLAERKKNPIKLPIRKIAPHRQSEQSRRRITRSVKVF